MLESLIVTALEQNFSEHATGDDGDTCCWTIADRKPRIWFGVMIPPRRKPHLEGKGLLARVRKIFALAKPGEANQTDRSADETDRSGDGIDDSGDIPGSAKRGAGKPKGDRRIENPEVAGSSAHPAAASAVIKIAIDLIEPDPENRDWGEDAGAIAELAESMTLHGQLQPCGVRPLGGGGIAAGGPYRLIFGEGRYRAAQVAELGVLDCRVYDVDEVGACELRLDENVRRRTLSPLDKLRDLARLVEHGKAAGITQAEIATRYGLSASALSNQLRVLRLPAAWLKVFSAEILPLAYSRLLLAKWCDERLLALLEPLAEELLGGKLELRTVEDFQVRIVDAIVGRTKPIDGWPKPPFNVTPKRRRELDVVEIPTQGFESPRGYLAVQ